ncbi:MAG: phosphoribosylamine--glycine ligase [Candidatus Heimdallarchaeota archaeon]|nr:phosphoribosylamine--glycine ligase [Candidatus Heimdallarchaeota archaeon]
MAEKDRILLVGQGAREHVIAKTLKQEPVELFAFMKAKNPGIAQLSSKTTIASLNDFEALEAFIQEVKPHFAVIGPENPLAEGIVDFLQEKDIPAIGPTKAVAKIESSKSFTRELMKKYDIPGLPEFRIFTAVDDEAEIRQYIRELGKVAVKRDGLAGGKGVKLLGEHLTTIDEAIDYCNEVFEKGETVVLEELLVGEEFSLQCFVSREDIIPTPIVQDHKRAYEDDEGPNTGGMGSYSAEDHLLPFISAEVVEEAKEIIQKTVKALKQESGNYCGILYGGFMLTAKGLKLLEFNARFGDPEAMNVLPLLQTPLIDIFKAMIKGTLSDIKVQFDRKATVCKYLVPKGYPVSPTSNKKITINEEKIKETGARLFFASVNETSPGTIITTTSRAIAIVGIADKLATAEQQAEQATKFVDGVLFHRKDVGTKKLIQKRIEHLKKLNVL